MTAEYVENTAIQTAERIGEILTTAQQTVVTISNLYEQLLEEPDVDLTRLDALADNTLFDAISYSVKDQDEPVKNVLNYIRDIGPEEELPEIELVLLCLIYIASGREDLKTLPIVAMSAGAFSEDIQRARAVGMNGHVAKPIEFDRLTETLECWLGQGR